MATVGHHGYLLNQSPRTYSAWFALSIASVKALLLQLNASKRLDRQIVCAC